MSGITAPSTRRGMTTRTLTLTPAVVLATLAAPAAAGADVVFGSPLTDPPNAIPFQHGWDQNVFNVAGPAMLIAPQPGLIKQVRVRGGSADGAPLQVKFRVVRPLAGGRFQAISTPVIATLPPNDGQVHSFDIPDPRAFRVQAGDMVAIYQSGGGGAGRRWQIASSQPGWTMQKVAVNNGFKDGALSPDPAVDQVGNSTLAYQGTEVLLQAVESEDRCPGTDLPQLPCRSKLYLGGRVRREGRALRYTWTIRNGGPHPAGGVDLRVTIPTGTPVRSVAGGCQATPGPPDVVVCGLGRLPPPQAGRAVRRISIVAVPRKRTRHFRAVGQIEAPGVVDPKGAAHHLKVVSVSTRVRR
jgi:uncharacterized repeat protein (TIGR01451 family)